MSYSRVRFRTKNANSYKNIGILPGIVSNIGKGKSGILYNRAQHLNNLPNSYTEAVTYMKDNNILSVNPTGSAAIGRQALLIRRRIGPCNCKTDYPFDAQLFNRNDTIYFDFFENQYNISVSLTNKSCHNYGLTGAELEFYTDQNYKQHTDVNTNISHNTFPFNIKFYPSYEWNKNDSCNFPEFHIQFNLTMDKELYDNYHLDSNLENINNDHFISISSDTHYDFLNNTIYPFDIQHHLTTIVTIDNNTKVKLTSDIEHLSTTVFTAPTPATPTPATPAPATPAPATPAPATPAPATPAPTTPAPTTPAPTTPAPTTPAPTTPAPTTPAPTTPAPTTSAPTTPAPTTPAPTTPAPTTTVAPTTPAPTTPAPTTPAPTTPAPTTTVAPLIIQNSVGNNLGNIIRADSQLDVDIIHFNNIINTTTPNLLTKSSTLLQYPVASQDVINFYNSKTTDPTFIFKFYTGNTSYIYDLNLLTHPRNETVWLRTDNIQHATLESTLISIKPPSDSEVDIAIHLTHEILYNAYKDILQDVGFIETYQSHHIVMHHKKSSESIEDRYNNSVSSHFNNSGVFIKHYNKHSSSSDIIDIPNALSIQNISNQTDEIKSACTDLIALDDTEYLLVPLIFMAPSTTSLTDYTNDSTIDTLEDSENPGPIKHPSSYLTIIQLHNHSDIAFASDKLYDIIPYTDLTNIGSSLGFGGLFEDRCFRFISAYKWYNDIIAFTDPEPSTSIYNNVNALKTTFIANNNEKAQYIYDNTDTNNGNYYVHPKITRDILIPDSTKAVYVRLRNNDKDKDELDNIFNIVSFNHIRVILEFWQPNAPGLLTNTEIEFNLNFSDSSIFNQDGFEDNLKSAISDAFGKDSSNQPIVDIRQIDMVHNSSRNIILRSIEESQVDNIEHIIENHLIYHVPRHLNSSSTPLGTVTITTTATNINHNNTNQNFFERNNWTALPSGTLQDGRFTTNTTAIVDSTTNKAKCWTQGRWGIYSNLHEKCLTSNSDVNPIANGSHTYLYSTATNYNYWKDGSNTAYNQPGTTFVKDFSPDEKISLPGNDNNTQGHYLIYLVLLRKGSGGYDDMIYTDSS